MIDLSWHVRHDAFIREYNSHSLYSPLFVSVVVSCCCLCAFCFSINGRIIKLILKLNSLENENERSFLSNWLMNQNHIGFVNWWGEYSTVRIWCLYVPILSLFIRGIIRLKSKQNNKPLIPIKKTSLNEWGWRVSEIRERVSS